MNHLLKPLLLLALLACSSQAYSQYYQVLPKGVRTFLIRNIHADVDSSYNRSKSESPYSFNLDANITNLENIELPLVQEALALIAPYPNAYNKISLGSHFFDANAQINAEVIGFGYGLTEKTSMYLGIPVFDANVEMNYKRTKGSSSKEVAEVLQGKTDDDYAQTLGNIIEQIYDIDGSTLQSAIVNKFNYNQIGSWHGQGLGDIELGFMHKHFDNNIYGFKTSAGFILPTGRVDDPDTLQDIGFGDGQLDIFAEFGGGYKTTEKNTVNSWIRYTYQFESQKELRVIEDKSVSLANKNGTFNEKLGDKIDLGVSDEYAVNDWLNLSSTLLANFTQKSSYTSKYSKANKALAHNTESENLNLKLAANMSSVKLFKAQKFILPAMLTFSYQETIQGKNTPKVNRTELEFIMFF